MSDRRRAITFLCAFLAFSSCHLLAQTDPSPAANADNATQTNQAQSDSLPSTPPQEDTGWRIAPENLNIQLGEDRALQVLDDSAQELKGATWSIDNPDLAELREQGDGVVVHPKAVGTVVVTAIIENESRTREIKIWSALRPIPNGTIRWSGHPIGREVGDIPAVPGDGPTMFSLEQTEAGKTYLRANREDGIQVWTWLMPETTHDAALVCGDWMGGALISASHEDSFTLYTVGKDGQLRWKHTFAGIRKGHAYNLQHLVHILSQSKDGTNTTLTGLDEVSGDIKFELKIPQSHENQKGVKRDGASVVCAKGSTTNQLPTPVSRLFVNMDGYAYVAFTHSEWTIDGGKCTPGTVLDPHDINLTRDDKLTLWQVHPDGTVQSIVVEATKITQLLSAPVATASPTGAILTDNMSGTLIPVRLSDPRSTDNGNSASAEFVYRINDEGELIYKLPMPAYSGTLHDEIVIGSDELGFATRGGTLIAFNVREGKELWQWDSKTDEISVVAALAGGSCLVQTPTDAVKVDSSTKSKVLIQGKVLIGWDGHVYRKHN